MKDTDRHDFTGNYAPRRVRQHPRPATEASAPHRPRRERWATRTAVLRWLGESDGGRGPLCFCGQLCAAERGTMPVARGGGAGAAPSLEGATVDADHCAARRPRPALGTPPWTKPRAGFEGAARDRVMKLPLGRHPGRSCRSSQKRLMAFAGVSCRMAMAAARRTQRRRACFYQAGRWRA